MSDDPATDLLLRDKCIREVVNVYGEKGKVGL
jgi:hypothetical protein